MKMSDVEPMLANVDKAVGLLKAMGNKHRLLILCLLQEQELSVSAINAVVPLAQSSVSQHLAWLRREGFVKTRRDAQTIYYSLDSEEVVALIATLHQLYCD